MDTIIQPIAISPIGSSTSQGRGRNHEQQLPAQGQVLKALVVEAQGSNRFVLDFGGTRLPVQTEAQLSLGQSIRLQVVRTEPQIELKIVAPALHQLQGRSLTLLGKNIDITSLIQGLRQQSPALLDAVSPASRFVLENFWSLQQDGIAGKEGGIVLKQLIDNLGLNLEQLLARGEKNEAIHTLKAALLEIAHTFSSASNIADTTNKIITTLELFQLAQLQNGSDTQLILPLPLPFIEQGYLVIERDDKGSESTGSAASESRFSLHLTVSELGDLQIDFLHNLEGLFVRFRAADQAKADFLATFGPDLKKAISDVPLVGLSFSGDARNPVHDLLRQLLPAGDSMLDTKV